MSDDVKPLVRLSGRSGNQTVILGVCFKAAVAAGWSKEKIDSVGKELTSGDYNNLLKVACKYFVVE